MARSHRNCKLFSGSGLRLALIVAALGCAASLCAQDSLASAGQMPSAPAAVTGSPDSFWDGGFMAYARHASGCRACGDPLFPEIGTGRNTAFGYHDRVLGTLIRFDLMGRNGSDARFSSSAGAFRLSYREMSSGRGPGANGNFGQGLADAGFTSSNFSNGMFNLSATGTYGGRPVTGTLRAGSSSFGSGPGGQRHSAPSVGVKLSF